MNANEIINDTEIIEKLIIQFITESYESWRTQAMAREPDLTATIIRDYVLDHARCPRALKFLRRRQQDGLIRTRLASLLRRKCIGSSIGNGDHGEARCYEPKDLSCE